jgi:glycogen operon protein
LDSIGNYLDWSTLSANQNHLNFMRGILRFRNEHPALRPDRFFQGRDLNGNGLKDITWYTSNGVEMTSADFDRTNGFIGYRIDTSTDSTGVRSIYAAFNAEPKGVSLKLPPPAAGYRWHRVADTDAWFETKGNVHPPGSEEVINGDYGMHPRCALLLVEKRAP